MGKGSFKLPVEVVEVAVVIVPGIGVKSIKDVNFVQGKDGIKRLEIEYVTELGYEGRYWFNANDFMRGVEEAKIQDKELKYVFNHHVELVPLE